MFYQTAQSALTLIAEVVAIAGFAGIVAHAIYTQHKQFMVECCPPVAPYRTDSQAYIDSLEDDGLTGEYGVEVIEEIAPEAIAEISKQAERLVTEAIPAVDAALESLKKVAKPRRKKTRQPKLQPMSVGAAAVDHAAMTSEQLRKECTLQGINWRSGGDYGKPMKKPQMLAVLR